MSDSMTVQKSITPIKLIAARTNSDLKTKIAVKISTSVEARATPDEEDHPEDSTELGHALKGEETTLHQQCSHLREEIQRVKAENDLLRQKNAILKIDLSDTAKALRAEEREHASTAKRVQDLEDRVNAFEQDAQALQNQIAELKAEKKGLAAEKRTAVSNLNTSKAKLEKCRRELIFVKGKLSDTQAELDIQRSKVKEGENEVQQLREENEKLVKNVADVERINKRIEDSWHEAMGEKLVLEKRLRICKPLVDVGAAVRRRYFERAKQDFSYGVFINVRGVADLKAIEAGHRAAHRANFAADMALFVLDYLDIESNMNTFAEIYGLDPSLSKINFDFVIPWAKRTEIMNMDATVRCLLRSNYTIDRTLYPGQFCGLYNQYTTAANLAVWSEETREKMDQDPDMNAKVEELRRIFEDIMSTTRRSRY